VQDLEFQEILEVIAKNMLESADQALSADGQAAQLNRLRYATEEEETVQLLVFLTQVIMDA
jgi:hypothetical protein